MARTKKSKPGAHGRAVAKAKAEGKPAPLPPPKRERKPKKAKNLNNKVTKSTKKAKKQKAEASRSSEAIVPESEDVVAISDDVEDTEIPTVDGAADADADLAMPSVEGPPASAPNGPRSERPRTRRQQAETKKEKQARVAVRDKADMDLADGIKNAFDQKRAVLVRLLHSSPQYQHLAKHLGRSAGVRDAMFKAIITSPFTQTAWITESKIKGVHGWFILCIFITSDNAAKATDGLEKLLNFEHHPEMNIIARLDSFMKFPGLANNINAVDATEPRKPEDMQPGVNEDAVRLLDLEVKKVKRKATWLGNTSSGSGAADKDVDMGGVLAKDTASRNLELALNTNAPVVPSTGAPPAKVRRRVQPELQPQAATPAQPRISQPLQKSAPTPLAALIPVAPKMQPVVESVPHKPTEAQPEATKTDEPTSSLTAADLSQMTYAEQQTFQCRYLGEVEPGIPVHGCVLCGQCDHVWEICPGRTCQHCGDQDKHSSRACTKAKKCSKCREKGHTVEQCPSKLKLTNAEANCERCGDDTHFEDDCSYIWRHLIPGTIVRKAPYLSVFCYNCAAQGHWGGDCPLKREKPRAHFDIFSAKEATKYIDASASPTNLLKESLECVKRSQDKSSIIKGAAGSRAQGNNYQAGYNQQPSEQPLSYAPLHATAQQHTAGRTVIAPTSVKNKHAKTKQPFDAQHVLAKYRSPSQAVYQAPVNMSPSVQPAVHSASYQSPVRPPSVQLRPLHTPPVWAPPMQPQQHQSYAESQPLTLAVRPGTNRGNDGYMSYQGNPRVNPLPRPRSRSPIGRTTGGYHQRDNYYAPTNGYAPPSGYHDARGVFHYQPPSRNIPPPPPPDNEYGRRQTFRAVPPPPPPPGTRRSGGGYGRSY